jgi:lipopolysaccharide transport system ATP-binding protein
VRVIDEDGKLSSAVDIRRKVGIEMKYEVLQSGKVLVPHLQFYNEQGLCIFVTHDWDGGWRDKPRPVGSYTSVAWIPENFLAEGTVFVTAAVSTFKPLTAHLIERDVVTFNVIDTLEGNSARGDHAGVMLGVVRPILKWETKVTSS